MSSFPRPKVIRRESRNAWPLRKIEGRGNKVQTPRNRFSWEGTKQEFSTHSPIVLPCFDLEVHLRPNWPQENELEKEISMSREMARDKVIIDALYFTGKNEWKGPTLRSKNTRLRKRLVWTLC